MKQPQVFKSHDIIDNRMKERITFEAGNLGVRAILRLDGEVDHIMYTELLSDIFSTEKKLSSVKEYHIYLNSFGGDFIQALAIYDLIKGLKKPVTIITAGYCMSAAVTILQAATTRLSLPNAQFLVHAGSMGTDEDDKERIRANVKHADSLDKVEFKIIKERIKVKDRTLKNWLKKETYLNAEKAKEAGIIDDILR